MRIALDANIFHSDRSLKGGNFEVLARLAEAGYVEVLIPEVIAREFTELSSDQVEALASFRETLKKLRDAFPKKLAPQINALKKDVRRLTESFESEAESTFNAWMQRVKGRVVKPSSDHAQRILAKYFDGNLPFGSRKARTDFPDAFIAEIILDLAADQELFFVVEDNRLARTFHGVTNVTIFNDLKKLLETDEFVSLQDRVVLAENLPRIMKILDANKECFTDALLEGMTNFSNHAHYKGEEDEDLFIDVLESINEWEFDDDAEYLGEGVISVTFDATVDASIDQPMDYGMDWYPWYSRPGIAATLQVKGTCSFIIDSLDLVDPATCLENEGALGRVRLEVDELHTIDVSDIIPDDVEY